MGKGGRYLGLTTLPPSWAVFVYSGNLNFLESSGPLQDFNGTALHLPFRLHTTIYTQLEVGLIGAETCYCNSVFSAKELCLMGICRYLRI